MPSEKQHNLFGLAESCLFGGDLDGLLEQTHQARRYLDLNQLGFKAAEYMNPDYTFVIRETPVEEYLKHFPKNLGEAVDKTETFVHGDKKAVVKLALGHIKLADVLRQFPLTDETKGMTAFEFLRHHGAVK